MKFIKLYLSVHRRMCLYFLKRAVRTYAIEVAAEYADNFDVPGAEICDEWEGENGSIIFVMRSNKELLGLSQLVKGINSIIRM